MRLGVHTVSVTREIKLSLRHETGQQEGLEWILSVDDAMVTMDEETFQALIQERERVLRTARLQTQTQTREG